MKAAVSVWRWFRNSSSCKEDRCALTAKWQKGKGSSVNRTIPFRYVHLPAGQGGGPRNLPSTALGGSPFVEEALRWLPDESQDEHDEAGMQDDLLSVPCPRSADEIARSRPRILLVDDNADMRQYVARLLSERYEVEAAADGQAALTAVHAQRPDLVLSDVMLPDRKSV